MGTTANLDLPYPDGGNPGNVPYYLQQLADAVDAALDDQDERLDTVEAAIADSGWIAPTLLNSWVNFGSTFDTAAYRKIGEVVYVRGLIKSGTTTSGTTIFTLPSGYRPSATRKAIVIVSGGSSVPLDIDSAGNVKAAATLNATATGLDFQFAI